MFNSCYINFLIYSNSKLTVSIFYKILMDIFKEWIYWNWQIIWFVVIMKFLSILIKVEGNKLIHVHIDIDNIQLSNVSWSLLLLCNLNNIIHFCNFFMIILDALLLSYSKASQFFTSLSRTFLCFQPRCLINFESDLFPKWIYQRSVRLRFQPLTGLAVHFFLLHTLR